MDRESGAMISIYTSNIKPRRNEILQCDYCHMKGHTKENCYKLIVYPIGPKFKKTIGEEEDTIVFQQLHIMPIKAQEEVYATGTTNTGHTRVLVFAPIFTHE